MSEWSCLRPLRIGCVQYLNARPLIDAYDGPVVFDHPSALARQIAAGELDAGLIPIFEALQHPHYSLVDDVAIACDGPVYSVYLAHRGPLSGIRRVALDGGSLTSVHLLKVLLSEYHGLRPDYTRDARGDEDALLWIGNQAIEFREKHGDAFEFLDLGAEWRRCTGLPFVFAVWMLRPGLEGLRAIGDGFRALQRQGLARLEETIAREPLGSSEFRGRYLQSHIRYQLGAPEKAAVAKFGDLLERHGLIPAQPGPLVFV